MFNRKSDYALNKKDATAIVYIDVDKHIKRLTPEDFSSEEEFLRWKNWSDANYHETEKRDHVHANHTVSIEGLAGDGISIQSVDAVLEAIYDRQEQERENAEAVARIKCCLSETQFRRLWLFRVEGLTVREIAKQEHISFQCVHKSVCAAEKKIMKLLAKWGDR